MAANDTPEEETPKEAPAFGGTLSIFAGKLST